MDGTFFIYGLFDSGFPDQLRYIGQTKSLSTRWEWHRKSNEHVGASAHWKFGVRYFGRSLQMRLVEVVYGTRRNSLDRERFHIFNEPLALNYGSAFARDVPKRVVSVYHRLIGTYRDMTVARRKSHVISSIGDALEELEREFPSMNLFPHDSWRYRTWMSDDDYQHAVRCSRGYALRAAEEAAKREARRQRRLLSNRVTSK